MIQNHWKALVLLSISWAIAAYLVNPVGDFPLNDDWAYGQNVYYLVEKAQINFSDWPAMTLVTQVIWGSLFCKIFGFSFTVLRFSTLVLAFGTSWLCYLLFLEIRPNRFMALLGSIMVSFNPMIFCLSFSFMTELPFLFFFLATTYFFLLYLKSDNCWYWLAACLFSVLTVLIRQTGVIAPLVFMVLFFFYHRRFSLKRLLLATAPLALSLFALWAYLHWLGSIQELPENYKGSSMILKPIVEGKLTKYFSWRHSSILFLVGLSLLPASWLVLPVLWKESLGRERIIAGGIAGLSILDFVFNWSVFPRGNVFYNFGLGPLLLPPLPFDGEHSYYETIKIPEIYWELFKLFGALTAVMALFLFSLIILNRFRNKEWLKQSPGFVFAILTVLGYHCFLMVSPYFFDRYIVFYIPLMLLIFFSNGAINLLHDRIFSLLSLITLLVLVGFGVAATHDYLSWNRARQKAVIYTLKTMQAAPQSLKAGFEWDNWLDAIDLMPFQDQPSENKLRYFLALDADICGREKVAAFPFKNWINRSVDSVFVLKYSPMDTLITVHSSAEQLTEDGKKFVTSNPEIFLNNGTNQDLTKAFTGEASILLTKEHPYGFTVRLGAFKTCDWLQISVWREGKARQAGIVVESDKFYKYNSKSILDERDGWELLCYDVWLTKDLVPEELTIYLWSRSEKPVRFDDISIELRRKR